MPVLGLTPQAIEASPSASAPAPTITAIGRLITNPPFKAGAPTLAHSAPTVNGGACAYEVEDMRALAHGRPAHSGRPGAARASGRPARSARWPAGDVAGRVGLPPELSRGLGLHRSLCLAGAAARGPAAPQ